MHTIAQPRHAVYALLALITGCAGNGEGLDQNGRPATAESPGTALTADFKSIQDNVFTPACATCHSGATAPRGLRLDAANSYSLLVGVASSGVPTLQRVKPGDPNTSYLIQKLAGTAAVGQRMPLGGPYLPQETIDVIKQWILNGAQRPIAAGSASTATALSVETTSPMANAVVDTAAPQIVVVFDRELDASLVNETTVRLERIVDTNDPNAIAPAVVLIAAQLKVSAANSSSILITPRTPLETGNYRVVLRGSGGAALAGLNAQPLNAILDSRTGQDFSLPFSVEVQK